MAARLELLKEQFFDDDGNVLSGGKLYTYIVGTTTEKATYTTVAGDVEQANPVVLDSDGRIPSDLYGVGAYKIVIKTSADVEIDTIPTVSGINSTSFTTMTDYSGDFDAAITAISSTPTTLYVDIASTMSEGVTVPSTCTVILEKGGSIDMAGSALTFNGPLIMHGGTITNDDVLTINGPFVDPGPVQLFTSTGTMTFGNGAVHTIYPQWWGGASINDGSTDATTSIRNAITVLETLGGGILRLVAGTYKVYIQASAEDILTINGNNITILGDGIGATKLDCYGIEAGSPDSVETGDAIFINGGDNAGATRKNILIKDLEIDGNATYTGDYSDFDSDKKGINIEADKYHDDIRIENVKIHDFNGELVYGGGIYIGSVYLINSILYNTNGGAYTVSGQNFVTGNEIYNVGSSCIEDIYVQLASIYRNNYLHDAALTIASFAPDATTSSEPYGPLIFENNVLEGGTKDGIYGADLKNAFIRNNIIIDSGVTTNYAGIRIYHTRSGEPAGRLENIHIENNKIIAHTQSLYRGFVMDAGTTNDAQGVFVKNNDVLLTKYGADNSKTIAQGFEISGDYNTSCIFENNRSEGSTYMFTDEQALGEELLTTTDATVVAQVRPYRNGFYAIDVHYRVVTDTTNVTINASWYDDAGTSLNEDMVASAGKAVGSYRVASFVVWAGGDSESEYVKVTATAGTANQVYVSANIRPVGLRGQNNN